MSSSASAPVAAVAASATAPVTAAGEQDASKLPPSRGQAPVNDPASSTAPVQPELQYCKYVTRKMVKGINVLAPPGEQADKVEFLILLDTRSNIRKLIPTSITRNKKMDDVILGERPEKLNRAERKRILQVQKHFNEISISLKDIMNGDKLCKRIQEALTAVIDKYTITLDPPTTRSQAERRAPASKDTADPPLQQPAVSPTEKTATAQASRRPGRALFTDESATIEGFKGDFRFADLPSVKNEASVIRATILFLLEKDRFTKFLVIFKNAHLRLATEISLAYQRPTNKEKMCAWILNNIGSIPEYRQQGKSTKKSFFKAELVQLVLVAVALSIYGEDNLSILCCGPQVAHWVDFALVSRSSRHNAAQQKCLRLAGLSNMKRAYNAAHYLALGLVMMWNSMLAPELRLTKAAMTWIFNFQCNLKAVPARVNQFYHCQVEKFIAAFIQNKEPLTLKLIQSRNYHDRLVEIARKVQSPEMRDALFEADGHALYASIGETFQRIESHFAQLGYSFGKIWDREEIENEHAIKLEAVLRQLPAKVETELLHSPQPSCKHTSAGSEQILGRRVVF